MRSKITLQFYWQWIRTRKRKGHDDQEKKSFPLPSIQTTSTFSFFLSSCYSSFFPSELSWVDPHFFSTWTDFSKIRIKILRMRPHEKKQKQSSRTLSSQHDSDSLDVFLQQNSNRGHLLYAVTVSYFSFPTQSWYYFHWTWHGDNTCLQALMKQKQVRIERRQ